MVVLRRTQKLAIPLPLTVNPEARSDTALGDWYVNRVVVDRRPLLLLISAHALLPIALPARDVAGLPDRLADVVAARLRRLSIPPELIQAEIGAMNPVIIAPTIDRSVLGILIDFAKAIPFYLDRGRADAGGVDAAAAAARAPRPARHRRGAHPRRLRDHGARRDGGLRGGGPRLHGDVT